MFIISLCTCIFRKAERPRNATVYLYFQKRWEASKKSHGEGTDKQINKRTSQLLERIGQRADSLKIQTLVENIFWPTTTGLTRSAGAWRRCSFPASPSAAIPPPLPQSMRDSGSLPISLSVHLLLRPRPQHTPVDSGELVTTVYLSTTPFRKGRHAQTVHNCLPVRNSSYPQQPLGEGRHALTEGKVIVN